MQDSETESQSRVPILGDIPLLGYLFRYTSKVKHKTNLLIMLTPYIIKDQSDLQRIQQRKMRQNTEFFRSVASLDGRRLEDGVDYRRRRGVVEEINRSIEHVEATAARMALPEPAAPIGVPAGAVPAGVVDDAAKDAEATSSPSPQP